MKKSITIGLVGAGGVGVVTIGEIILKIAKMSGYYGRLSKYYDSQIRGGGSAVKINIHADPNSPADDDIDILVCFSQEKLLEFKEELSLAGDTMVFLEEETSIEVLAKSRLALISFGKISNQATGREQNKNLVALGLLLEMLGLGDKDIFEEIKKQEKILAPDNLKAVEAGRNEAKKLQTDFSLNIPKERPATIIIDGNRAVSRGALRAGCKFAAAYPITPASEIGEDLSRELPKIGGVFIQGESEIASAAMVLGASLGGVKSMTATSGPGFDLMMEIINLASSSEISIVVVDVQRAGPSTGMPTKTEQSDLSAAIFGGHGYAPRVVLAPHNVEGCYRLAVEAFNIAERYQVPVIFLSDQYLGQTLRIVDDFTKKEYRVENRLLPDPGKRGRYSRYKLTSDFVSPLALPGMEGFTWRAVGLTHDEKGHPASGSGEWQNIMQEKITKKLDSLRTRQDLVNIFGSPKTKIGLISWGSSGEAALMAVKRLGLEKKIKVCIPELITPMPKEIIGGFLNGLKKLLIVEMNYSGQYHGFLRRYFNLPERTFVCKRAGGRPWSQKELERFILGVLK